MKRRVQKKNTEEDKGSVVIETCPTFLLKGVNPAVIFSEYKEGKYNGLSISDFRKVKVSMKNTNVMSIGIDEMSNIYTSLDNNNISQVYATSNCLFFNSFISGNPTIFTCSGCSRKFDHPPVGIPIRENIYDEIYVYDTPTCHCDLRCAFADFLKNEKKYSVYTEYFLKKAWKIKTGKDTMYPVFGNLLAQNGGSLDESELFSDTHEYRPTNKVVFCPMKLVYQKVKQQ
jgi:hypothetical protein